MRNRGVATSMIARLLPSRHNFSSVPRDHRGGDSTVKDVVYRVRILVTFLVSFAGAHVFP